MVNADVAPQNNYSPNPTKYNTPADPLDQPKPKIPIKDPFKATEQTEPFPCDKETDVNVGGALADSLIVL